MLHCHHRAVLWLARNASRASGATIDYVTSACARVAKSTSLQQGGYDMLLLVLHEAVTTQLLQG